jgi:sugar lactone lactonase YvrE
VYGQQGDFTSGTANLGGRSADSLSVPYGVETDLENRPFIVELTNNRVLYFGDGSTTATRVYGQSGDFTTAASATTADALSTPYGLAFDPDRESLYISDRANSRALAFLDGSTTAARVYGQLGDFTTGVGNNGAGVSENGLNIPGHVAVDSAGNLYVTDGNNNRLLVFPEGSTTPTRVYGQQGSFASATANLGGVSADSLSGPEGVAIDSENGVYVSDRSNHRVLYYPAGSTTATRVYGQGGDFTASTANNGGVSADSFNFPAGLSLDGDDNLFVADSSNNRVLMYTPGSTTAARVYGQGGDFTANIANNGGVSADSLSSPQDAHVSCVGDLYIADGNNNRVLRFGPD